jgi:hypothetical protein
VNSALQRVKRFLWESSDPQLGEPAKHVRSERLLHFDESSVYDHGSATSGRRDAKFGKNTVRKSTQPSYRHLTWGAFVNTRGTVVSGCFVSAEPPPVEPVGANLTFHVVHNASGSMENCDPRAKLAEVKHDTTHDGSLMQAVRKLQADVDAKYGAYNKDRVAWGVPGQRCFKMLLIWDGHATHSNCIPMRALRDDGYDVHVLSPGLTHLIQVCDDSRFNGVIKGSLRSWNATMHELNNGKPLSLEVRLSNYENIIRESLRSTNVATAAQHCGYRLSGRDAIEFTTMNDDSISKKLDAHAARMEFCGTPGQREHEALRNERYLTSQHFRQLGLIPQGTKLPSEHAVTACLAGADFYRETHGKKRKVDRESAGRKRSKKMTEHQRSKTYVSGRTGTSWLKANQRIVANNEEDLKRDEQAYNKKQRDVEEAKERKEARRISRAADEQAKQAKDERLQLLLAAFDQDPAMKAEVAQLHAERNRVIAFYLSGHNNRCTLEATRAKLVRLVTQRIAFRTTVQSTVPSSQQAIDKIA